MSVNHPNFLQTHQQRANFYRKLQNRLDDALQVGAEVARANCPIDTSSLLESINVNDAEVVAGMVIGGIQAGGIDYRGKFFARTGKYGRLVDYAEEQDLQTGFLSGAVVPVYTELSS